METVRCVDLLDLRQGEFDLPPVVGTLCFLTWITFQIDRFELLMFRELGIEIVNIRDLVIVRLGGNEKAISALALPENVYNFR